MTQVATDPAHAADASVRYQEELNGGATLASNAFFKRSSASASSAVVPADVDSDPTTGVSSAADLVLPAGSKVVKAVLAVEGMGGSTPADTLRQLKFTLPSGVTHSLDASSPESLDRKTMQTHYVQSIYDVTGLVDPSAFTSEYVAGGDPSGAGRYVVGANRGTFSMGGWSLLVAYENPDSPLRSVTISDNWQYFTTGTTVTTDIPGVKVPATGPVKAVVGVTGTYGDHGYSDELLFGPSSGTLTRLSNPNPTSGMPVTDALNSSIGMVPNNNVTTDGGPAMQGCWTARNPYSGFLTDYAADNKVTKGCSSQYDASVFDATGAVSASPNAVNLRLSQKSTGGDVLASGSYFVSVDIAAATLTKSISPERINSGERATYTFTVDNTQAGALNQNDTSFTDNLPTGLIVADPANVTVSGESGAAIVTAEPGSGSITVTGLGIDAGTKAQITVDVTNKPGYSNETCDPASPAAEFTNGPGNISNIEGGISNGVKPVCLEVGAPTLSFVKTSDATKNTRVGDTVTYVVTATNNSNADFTTTSPAVVFDDLAAVLDDAAYNDDASANQPGPVSYAAPLLSWSGPLKKGESVEVKYSVTMKAGGDGTVRNVAWEPNDPTTSTPPACAAPEDGIDPDTGEACASNEVKLPKVSVTKKADRGDLPAIGETVTYTVTVQNDGPGDFTEDKPATFVDDLSDVIDSADFNEDASASTGAVSYSEPKLSWFGALPAGESATVSYTATYTGKGDKNLRNTVCVKESDLSNGALACDIVQIPGAGLTQWKSVKASADPVVAGTELSYTLFFNNDGKAVATVDAVDDLTHVLDDATVSVEPVAVEGLVATRTDNRIAVTGSVKPGETASVTYTVVLKQDGERGDDIAANFLMQNDPGNPPVVPAEPECKPGDSDRPDCTVTNIASIQYAKSVKSSTDTVEAGTVLTYTITAKNTGTAKGNVSREDVLTDVLDDAKLSAAPESDVESVTVSKVKDGRFSLGGTLAAGKTAKVTYKVTVNEETARGNNTINNFIVPAGEEPPATCDEGSKGCTTTPLPFVSVEKSADPASGEGVKEGDAVTYTLHFRNSGNAKGVVDFSDDLSGVLDDADLVGDLVSSVPGVTGTVSSKGIVRIVGELDAGAEASVTYVVKVKPVGKTGDKDLRNLVAKTGTPKPECGDPGVSCTENPVGELRTWKGVDPASGSPVAPEQVLTYTLYFENTGKSPVAVERVDNLTGVLDDAEILAAPTSSNPSLTVSTVAEGQFMVTGSLDAGAEASVSYSVKVKANGEGDEMLANFLLKQGETPSEACATTEGADPNCTVNYVSEVTAVKSSDPEDGSTVYPGDKVTYSLKFTNVGGQSSAVEYTDYLVDVLDDARIVEAPVSSLATVTAKLEGDQITVRGELPKGETVTVTYAAQVKDVAQQGNRSLGNVIAITGKDPVCISTSDLCTKHPVSEKPGLAITGGAGLAMLAGLGGALLLAGAVLVVLKRHRRSEMK
ncbi:putative repeat protein (TIGR01451 family)/fimbrial isopeptide formation D2 family protein [Leucobacter luti]|uniref:DUF7927 domain-containing protein n=1 Tax=Leucobacter luti TaxID=340320 RepID=UPI0022278FA3|nr:hypothetical protein [Leucobacter luti]MCW2289024.1 putative repeat protein (TIGR01451 family)/fimbrial isopeptide formation D2 family protein [Leucobacter luti]